MPLSESPSKKAREENIEREIAAGKPPKQAVAIGYAKQRENKAKDGRYIIDALRAIDKLLG